VLAGDRTTLRARARRHSAQVKLLKYALPLSTVAIFGLYGLSVLQTTGWGAGFGELAIPQIIPENIAMENPHYEGFNKDGGRYWVRAKTAQQDLKNLNLIKLNGITGELMDAKKLTTKLAATRGTFDNKANLLELFDAIDISGETGLKARLTRATVKTKENIITLRPAGFRRHGCRHDYRQLHDGAAEVEGVHIRRECPDDLEAATAARGCGTG
jgi:hypothetical protein